MATSTTSTRFTLDGFVELEDSFIIKPELLNGMSNKNNLLKRLVSMELFSKYKKSFKVIQVDLIIGSFVTIKYKFLAPPNLEFERSLEVVDVDRDTSYSSKGSKDSSSAGSSSKVVKMSTTVQSKGDKDSSAGSGSAASCYLDLSKLSMTFVDDKTGKGYFQTHTGEVFDNHFLIGQCAVKPKNEGVRMDLHCDHEWVTFEKQTRSGDEAISVFKVCRKCNVDQKNIHKRKDPVSEEDIEELVQDLTKVIDRPGCEDDIRVICQIYANIGT